MVMWRQTAVMNITILRVSGGFLVSIRYGVQAVFIGWDYADKSGRAAVLRYLDKMWGYAL